MHLYISTLSQVCPEVYYSIFACCCDWPGPCKPVNMWLPAGIYLLALSPMGARCNTLEFDEGNWREEPDVRQSFLASYHFFCVCVCACVCVSRFCLLWLTPLCLATEHSPCSHSSGLSGLETQQLYCVCMCVLVCGPVYVRTCALISSVYICILEGCGWGG